MLSKYRPDYIQQAPDQIAQEMGFKNVDSMRQNYRLLESNLNNPDISPEVRANIKELRVFHNPWDLICQPADYVDIHMALGFLHDGLQGVRILQLACNFGPYLHFLQNVKEANVSGIEINPVIAHHARKNGLDVIRASATSLPFADGEFDHVISRNFLVGAYLCAWPKIPYDFVPRTVREVERVLKPGGIFISDHEDNLAIAGRNSFSPEMSSFRRISNMLRVWQKAA
jgi:SAM-dependent methyltransferase